MRASCSGVKPSASSRWPRAADCACAFSVLSRASAIMFMFTGKPVSGSVAASMPVLPMNGVTPNFDAVT
jgi:hypothetical protein